MEKSVQLQDLPMLPPLLVMYTLYVSDNEFDNVNFPHRALLAVRSQFGMLDDGARFHVIAHLIREAVDCGKLMLVTSIVGRDDTLDTGSISKEAGTIQNLIQKDRVLAAVCHILSFHSNSHQ